MSGANELTIAVDPAEAGLDSGRLKRIDAHFARYVDDGRLAGWLLTVGLTVSFFTQLLPSSIYPIRPQLRQLVYQALTS